MWSNTTRTKQIIYSIMTKSTIQRTTILFTCCTSKISYCIDHNLQLVDVLFWYQVPLKVWKVLLLRLCLSSSWKGRKQNLIFKGQASGFTWNDWTIASLCLPPVRRFSQPEAAPAGQYRCSPSEGGSESDRNWKMAEKNSLEAVLNDSS